MKAWVGGLARQGRRWIGALALGLMGTLAGCGGGEAPGAAPTASATAAAGQAEGVELLAGVPAAGQAPRARIAAAANDKFKAQVATTTEHRWVAFVEYVPWLLAPLAMLRTRPSARRVSRYWPAVAGSGSSRYSLASSCEASCLRSTCPTPFRARAG